MSLDEDSIKKFNQSPRSYYIRVVNNEKGHALVKAEHWLNPLTWIGLIWHRESYRLKNVLETIKTNNIDNQEFLGQLKIRVTLPTTGSDGEVKEFFDAIFLKHTSHKKSEQIEKGPVSVARRMALDKLNKSKVHGANYSIFNET